MIGSLTFTRDDGATFAFSATNPPFQLTPDTQLPAGLTLDVAGGEYTGRNGGYTLAGRLQRRTAKIVCNVRETYSDSRSMVELLNDAAEFFRPMTADLRIVSFTMLVQTDDSSQSAYLMRQGHVTTPFMAPLLRGGHGSYAAEFDLIFDDPLLYWADGSGVVSGDILPAALPGSKIGEVWQEGLQVWAAGLSRWEYPDQGGGGTPQTVHVVSAYQVSVAFTITGQITNPKIVNSRNGSQWSWEGTIPYGRMVTVDVDGVATDWQGNRLLNTMGGLVAAPGDNTFTLTGSDLVLDLQAAWVDGDLGLDLQAAWTGAPNASTSILSQEGHVVATNLIRSPKPLAAEWMWTDEPGQSDHVVTVTDTSDGMAVSARDGNSDSYAAMTNIPCNPGTTYHIVADLVRIDGPTWPNGPLFACEVDVNGGILATHTTIGGSGSGVLQADFTTAPTAVYINIRLHAPLDVTQQTVWRHIGLYTAPDWQAMQALGVTWFDGDSRSTRISTLSQDGQVVATNLLMNPKPVSTGTITGASGGLTISDTPDGMMLTYSSGEDVYVDIRIQASSSTQYVVSAELVALANATALNGNGALFVYTQDANQNILSVYLDKGDYHIGVHSRTITTDANAAYVIVRLYCPYNKPATATWRNAGVYPQSDWQAMQALGVTWFDGDSATSVVTAKASVDIRGAF